VSYQVLARKYRSMNFDELVGQDHVSRTLINAIKNDRFPHALLFTGLRGTGKTSTARILAKTLRCENRIDFKPCNKCNSCEEINSGSSVDVLEIDGASNNGVDSIRDLRETVMFSPSRGKYKILIIDEVHMLSTSAFNALLKTLEEPPAHVIFMMATTEVQKIPVTILSRCQRFDLRRISLTELTRHLKNICELESIKATEKALWLIARQGDGSARDSLSLLDQVINFSTGEITEQSVNSILGLTERSLLYSIFADLLQRNEDSLVASLKKVALSGTSPSQLLEDYLRLIRHSLLLKSVKLEHVSELTTIELPDEEIQQLIDLVKDASESDLHMLFDMGLKSLQDVSRGFDPLLVLEIGLLRMCQAPKMISLQQFFSSIPQTLPVNKAPLIKPVEKKSPESIRPTAGLKVPASTQPSIVVKPHVIPPFNPESWLDFVVHLKSVDSYLAAQTENLVISPASNLSAKKVIFHLPASFAFLGAQLGNAETKKKLQAFIDSYFGQGYTFEVLNEKAQTGLKESATTKPIGDSAVSLAQKKEATSEAQMKEAWQKDPRVQKAQEIFKGELKIISTDSKN
jgi:DNA polymerase III subunit gamma/tau